MPPRAIVVLIVLFWLVSMGLLVEREIAPRWRAGTAPAYNVELTDEVGSPQVEWQVFHKDNLIGRGHSHVRRQPDRSFEMSQVFRFDDFEIPAWLIRLKVKKLESVYRVTREGNLLALTVKGRAAIKEPKGAMALDVDVDFQAKVENGYLVPKLLLFGSPIEMPGFDKVAMTDHGSILNPMHLLHRLPGLREGQKWRVPLLDPLSMFSAKDILGQNVPGMASPLPFLEAEVESALYHWNKADVECLRIAYREPGKNEVARTYVRRQDGLVLAQEARQHGYDFAIRRVP